MKIKKVFLAILGASFLLSSAAFAGPAAKAKLRLSETLNVEGKQLTPGEYNVTLDGSGSDLKLNIAKGKDNVVSVPAQVDAAEGKHVGSGYGSKTEADGSKSLTAIYIGGTKYNIEPASATAETPAR